MATEPLISVIVPTFKRPLQVRDLLGSLERQLCRSPFEVIVVCNLPDNALKKTVESFGKNFRYYETGRVGTNFARNKGLEKARGHIALFLDDDCYVLNRDFLQKHLDLHAAHPEAIGIGGRYSLKSGASVVEKAYHWILDHGMTKSQHDLNVASSLIGGHSSYKIRSIGRQLRFNDKIVFGGSETELCLRLARNGHTMLQFDDLMVEHRLTMNRFEFARRAYLQGFGAGGRELEGLKPLHRHWNSTVNVEQSMKRSGENPDPQLRSLFSTYERFFAFGSHLANRALDRQKPAPPLRWKTYFAYRLQQAALSFFKPLIHNTFHILDRSLAITRREQVQINSTKQSA